MNGKERIKRVIEFKKPDRIPISSEDMFTTGGDRNWIVKKWCLDDTSKTWFRHDIWGCAHKSANRDLPGYYVENHPLDSWDKVASYKFPNPKTVIPFLEKNLAQMKKDPDAGKKYHLLDVDPGPLLIIINVMEHENFLVQCVENPDQTAELYQRITDYKFELIRLGHEMTKPDGVVVFEDWGSQHGALISPDMFRELFKPAVKSMADRVHALGMHYGLQGSGDLGGVLDEYMDAGLDFLWECQICSKRWDVLPKKIRGKLAIMSCCDAQTTLPLGAPDDVRAEVARIKENFATPKGGLIYLVANTPGGMPVSAENQEAQRRAMYEACGLPCPTEPAKTRKKDDRSRGKKSPVKMGGARPHAPPCRFDNVAGLDARHASRERL